ncbi:hypothetical protein [Hymenobacter terricola]|uniref:hypothetical protein n=1 Tax=Hymenobacter terricola TaxID=2819236 RepID=UPI001B305F8F|nr:hypothetical protein [Hymenobacter terricola]
MRREATRRARCQKRPGHLGATHAKARPVSNKTPGSPTDPEARISVKPDKMRALTYLCSVAVDTAQGIISQGPAGLADRRDSVLPAPVADGLAAAAVPQELRLRKALADAGHANGPNDALLEQQQVIAWIPVFGKYKSAVEGFP